MKLKLLLLLALVLMATLALFPDFAKETLTIEAFGWHIETHQSTFIIITLLTLFAFWLVQRITLAVMAGPGHIWQTLRNGSQQRRENHLQQALQDWLNLSLPFNKRAFKKARSLMPEWAQGLIDTLRHLPHEHLEVDSQSEPLQVALQARLVSDPEWKEVVDVKQRQAHLEAWLQRYPQSTLAQIRLLDIHLEQKAWHEALSLLSKLKNQPLRSQAWMIEQKVRVYLALAESEPEQTDAYLKQAEKLSPHHAGVVLAKGRALQEKGLSQEAEKLWLNHLKKHDDLDVAQAALTLMRSDGLAAFRRMEKLKGSHALMWLHASLAHAGKLDGLAQEALDTLLREAPHPLFWQTRAQWHSEHGDWVQAQHAYEQVITLLVTPPAPPTHSTEQ